MDRRWLATVALTVGGLGGAAPAAADLQSLRTVADRAGVRFGTAVQVPGLRDLPHAGLVERHANVLTFENDTKWGLVHPERHRYDFTKADEIAGWAQARGLKVRGHVLAWHVSNPDWLTRLQPTRDEAIELLRDHIDTVVGHFRTRFPGVVVEWDVVNEGIDNDGSRRQSVWQRWIGDDYVDLAFRFARAAAGPDVRLYYNDYFDAAMVVGAELMPEFDDGDPVPMPSAGASGSLSCEEVVKCRAVKALVTELVRRGAPIDGVGFQAHLAGSTPSDHRGLTAWVGKLGLRWAVTEMDRPIPPGGDAGSRQLQAMQMAAVAQACIDDPACDTIILWGLSDRYTWWQYLPGGAFPDALAFDRELEPKPAAHELLRVLETAPSVPPVTAGAVACTRRRVTLRVPRRRGERLLGVTVRLGRGRPRRARRSTRVRVVLPQRSGRIRIAVRARLRSPAGRKRTATVVRTVTLRCDRTSGYRARSGSSGTSA